MEWSARGLAERGIATLRYQFPYMENGGGRPDPPQLAQATVRAAVAGATDVAPDLPLFAGGRSYGGRMTSQAQSIAPLPNVRGLAFLGFPLHPPGKPSAERAEHLEKVEIPMLFVSGSRDALAELELLKPLVKGLGKRATLQLIDQADHGLRVPAKSGRTAEQAQAEALDAVAAWMTKLS
jgi:predicted alpha/beta-hydrolase family hydrolase